MSHTIPYSSSPSQSVFASCCGFLTNVSVIVGIARWSKEGGDSKDSDTDLDEPTSEDEADPADLQRLRDRVGAEGQAIFKNCDIVSVEMRYMVTEADIEELEDDSAQEDVHDDQEAICATEIAGQVHQGMVIGRSKPFLTQAGNWDERIRYDVLFEDSFTLEHTARTTNVLPCEPDAMELVGQVVSGPSGSQPRLLQQQAPCLIGLSVGRGAFSGQCALAGLGSRCPQRTQSPL